MLLSKFKEAEISRIRQEQNKYSHFRMRLASILTEEWMSTILECVGIKTSLDQRSRSWFMIIMNEWVIDQSFIANLGIWASIWEYCTSSKHVMRSHVNMPCESNYMPCKYVIRAWLGEMHAKSRRLRRCCQRKENVVRKLIYSEEKLVVLINI